VIAGVAGGRRLSAPDGRATRPTSDRAREGLFGTVRSLHGDLDGARVLDVYAGSGALGFEALSRGAAHALLIESDAKAVRVLRANAASLGLPGARIVADRAERVMARGPGDEAYDIAFLDPPYAMSDGAVRHVLELLCAHRWLMPGALVAVERATRGAAPPWPAGYEPGRARRYGEATLWYGHAAST